MKRITKAPWQSIPGTVLYSVLSVGFREGIRDLRAEGFLAKARGVRDSIGFEEIKASIHEVVDSDAALLWPWRQWHRNRSRELAERHPSVAVLLGDVRFRDARREMQPMPEARWDLVAPALLRRVGRWADAADGFVSALRRFFSTKPPPDLANSLLRPICYACTTPAWSHHVAAPCVFCGALACDRQPRCLGYAEFRAWLQHRAGWLAQPSEDDDARAWIMRLAGEADPVGITALFAIGAALQAFDAKRSGSIARTRHLMDASVGEVFCCEGLRRPGDWPQAIEGVAGDGAFVSPLLMALVRLTAWREADASEIGGV